MNTSSSSQITVTDLFAGAGGLTRGLIEGSSRFLPKQAVEWEPDAAATYEENFQDADVICGDIVSWAAAGTINQVDVIVGGPPCQGFSSLGKQDANDEKNFLWHQYAKVVAAARPRYFIMENVPQFMKSQQLEVFRSELEAGGLFEYTATIREVNTADFGAPQNRKRMIILGTRKGFPQLTLPAAEFMDCPRTVQEVLGDLPTHVSQIDLPPKKMVYQGKVRPGPFTTQELHVTRKYTELSRRRFAEIGPGGNRFDLPDELKAPCWIKHTTGSGDVMGRLRWDRPSVTIRTEFNKPEKGRYLHPEEDRAITHLEAARLMGFPDDYLWVGTKTSIARQIGNAVPVALGKALGEQLAKLFH